MQGNQSTEEAMGAPVWEKEETWHLLSISSSFIMSVILGVRILRHKDTHRRSQAEETEAEGD